MKKLFVSALICGLAQASSYQYQCEVELDNFKELSHIKTVELTLSSISLGDKNLVYIEVVNTDPKFKKNLVAGLASFHRFGLDVRMLLSDPAKDGRNVLDYVVSSSFIPGEDLNTLEDRLTKRVRLSINYEPIDKEVRKNQSLASKTLICERK